MEMEFELEFGPEGKSKAKSQGHTEAKRERLALDPHPQIIFT